MRYYPAPRCHPRLVAVQHHRRHPVLMRTRLFWFTLGFSVAGTVAGFLSGVFHWPN